MTSSRKLPHIKVTMKPEKQNMKKGVNIISVTNITAENFNTEVLESEKPVLLDFWAPWCGPCRMFSSTVDSVAEERNDIKVGKINIDENIDLANQFGVASIPTLVLVQDGRKKASSIGLRSKKDVLKMLDA